MTTAPRQFFPWRAVLQGFVSVMALTYVGWRLYEDRASLQSIWEHFAASGWPYAVVGMVLVGANLGLEAEKWRVLIRPMYPQLGRWTAQKAVLAGMAAGFFTPNRIGDYAGRILFLPVGHRIEAAVATFADRICQLGVTLVAGIAVLAWFMGTNADPLFGKATDQALLVAGSLSLGAFFLFLFFPHRAAHWLRNSSRTWLQQIREGLLQLQVGRLLRVFFLATLRYAVFTTQYILLILAFEPELSVPLMATGCVLVFLAKSVLPLPGVLELGVRESIAVTVFGVLGAPEGSIVHATFAIYLINIVLPTLLGVVAWQDIRWTQREEEGK